MRADKNFMKKNEFYKTFDEHVWVETEGGNILNASVSFVVLAKAFAANWSKILNKQKKTNIRRPKLRLEPRLQKNSFNLFTKLTLPYTDY